MKFDIETYKIIKEKIKELESGILEVCDKSEIDRFYQELDSKLGDFNPQLMMYGCYNAGKSTIVNALLGKEVAKVSDKPETSKIDKYEYNGYTIYDTPGINAPQKHEEITQEHYKKCEIIIFVMNGGDLESEINYEVIKKVVDDKKPVLIVLNQKQGVSEEEEKLQTDKIYHNLEKCAISDEEIQVIVLNAKNALKGKLENKPLLLKDSGFIALENAIDRILRENGTKSVMNVCNKKINEFISQVSQKIDSHISNINIKNLEELRTSYNILQVEAEAEMKAVLDEIANRIYDELREIIYNNDEGAIKRLEANVYKELEDRLNQVLSKLTNDFNRKINNKKIENKGLVDSNTIDSNLFTVDNIAKVALGVGTAIALIPHPIARIAGGVIGAISTLAMTVFGTSKEEREKMEQEKIRRSVDEAKKAVNELRSNGMVESKKAIYEIAEPIIKSIDDEIAKNKNNENNLTSLKKELIGIAKGLPI